MYPAATTLRGPSAAPQTMIPMDLQQPCVLVVDDDPDLRKLIGEFLSAHGYQVDMAENVAEMRSVMAQRRRTSSYST